MVYKIHWKDIAGQHSRTISTIDMPCNGDFVLIEESQQILRVLWRLLRDDAVTVVYGVLVSDETADDLIECFVGRDGCSGNWKTD